MKAIVFTRYGSPDVLDLKEVEKPTPRDDEVLIKVHAASLNDWDWGALQGIPFVRPEKTEYDAVDVSPTEERR